MRSLIEQTDWETQSSADLAPFRLFTVYDDATALLEAGRIEDLVAEIWGTGREPVGVYWNFSMLRNDHLRHHAAEEAAGAQLVIVSVSACEKLPAHIRPMLENLPHRGQPGEAAIVLLIGYDQQSCVLPPAVVEDVRAIAKERGYDFFCNWSLADNGDSYRPLFDKGERRAPRYFEACQVA